MDDKQLIESLRRDNKLLTDLLNLLITKKRMELADLEAHYARLNAQLKGNDDRQQ